MGVRKIAFKQLSADEQREFSRHKIELPGKLFLPAEKATFECQVLNISCGGAGIQCEEPPPLHSYVVLYIDGFGRFESIAMRFIDGELGLQFVCNELKCRRLLFNIFAFVSDGLKPKTRTRRHRRVASTMLCGVMRPNGDWINCSVLDISPQGISLRTDLRPPIGELTNLGRTYGRVVRHHSEGIAIEFLETSENASDGN